MRHLLDDPGRFLAVSQLGLTVIGFFASAYAAVSLVPSRSPTSSSAPASNRGRGRSSLVTVTVLLALFTIVFAELVPKTVALAYADRVARLFAGPIEVLAGSCPR